MTVLRPFYVDSPSDWDHQEDSMNFPTDPDQLHDKLPQPFRLINKILDEFLGDTWQTIVERGELREAEETRLHLPKLGNGIKSPTAWPLYGLAQTQDEEFVVACGTGGLLSLSPDDVSRVLHTINTDRKFLKVCVGAGGEDETHIVAALNEKGEVEVYGLTKAGFIEIATLKEDKVIDISISASASTLVLCIAGPDDVTNCSFYSLPVSSWSEPLDQISVHRLQGNTADPEVAFLKVELVGKVEQPPTVQPGKASLSEALVNIMNSVPTVLGQGYQHILPGTYFEKRQKQLATVERYQGVDWAQLQTRQSVPTCVHVNESQVLLWWSGHHIATVHYTGTAKDIESPEQNHIFTSPITSVVSSGDLIGVGLETGLVAVIRASDGITLQTSLVSKSPVSHLCFLSGSLIAAAKDSTVAVLSCSVEAKCALVQHISSDTVQYTVTQLMPVCSNMAVVVLSPARVVLINTESYRAVATLPTSSPVTRACMLNKDYICLMPLDADCFNKALKDIHPLALSYGTVFTAGATEMDEESHILVYKISEEAVVVEQRREKEASPLLTLRSVTANYFLQRESYKAERHERLRRRWFQYTEELDCRN